MNSVKIYGVSFSYFVRVIRILCQYKGLPYELTTAPFGQEIPIFTDAHTTLHPFKKMPVLIDGDLILPESTAIARYLDSKESNSHPSNQPTTHLFPHDPTLKAQTDSTANLLAIYGARTVVAGLILEFALPKGEGGAIRFDVAQANIPAAQHTLQWMEALLNKHPHYLMAQQFTLCDAYAIPMLDYLSQLPAPFNLLPQYPQLQAYLSFHQPQAYCEGILGEPDLSVLGNKK